MHRSTSFVRRACAVGTATALIGLTTGLGVMTATTASAAELPTADPTAVAAAVPGAEATTPAAAPTTPAEPSLPSGDTAAPTAPDSTTGGDAGTGAAPTAPVTGTPTSPATTAPAAPAASTPAATPSAEAAPTAAATATVTISGKAKVGETLRANPKGFTAPAALSYEWSVDGVGTGDQGSTYDVDADDAGEVVTVTVRNTAAGHTDEEATATTAAVTQTPVFVDADGKPVEGGTVADEDSLPLEATAGEAFSYTFRAQGFPAPTLALSWYYDGEEADPDHPEDTPEGQLPEGIEFDAATGVLSGTTEWASSYDFAVTATSGTESVTQYVELTVDAGAAAGVQVIAADRADYEDLFDSSGVSFGFVADESSEETTDDGTVRTWIIDEQGDISTVDLHWTTGPEGSDVEPEFIPGGKPTVDQGGTLVVNGGVVDRFGNLVTDADGEPTPISVTSDVTSDVIEVDNELWGYNAVDVTFPHASTHTLTVASDVLSTSFPVEVVPTATAPVVTPPASVPPVVTPPTAAAPIGSVPVRTASHGRLAYTGTDSTDALPWALAMLAAGAALVGLRIVRRRAQR